MTTDASTVRREVARSVDASRALLPVFAELFNGIDALGSMPTLVVREFLRAGVTSTSRVLDLACGKGAVSVAIAQHVGCKVIGVDAFPAFVDSARELALRRGVESLARFRAGIWQDARGRYDVAMMLGLLPLLDAADVLRSVTSVGGVYVIDDCWWDARRFPRYRNGGMTREESIAAIESLGDVVERVVTPTPTAVRKLNDSLYRSIALNASRVSKEHPRLRPAIREFLASQRHANRLLGGPLRPALWVIRRS